MGRLSDRVALITGAGQGLGLGIAQAFASEGANLVITGRDARRLEGVVPELSERGAKVVLCPGDASCKSNAAKAVEAAIAAFGRLDVLVNNAQAGIVPIALEDVDEPALRLVLESGLFGTIYHMQAAFPHLQKRGGSIINFGSIAGTKGMVSFAHYAATKEGIRGLSRVAAREWGRHGIRVNVICPTALSASARKFLEDNPEFAEASRKEISLGYFGNPEKDIGSVALFLASDDSRYVSGQTINADGGTVMF